MRDHAKGLFQKCADEIREAALAIRNCDHRGSTDEPKRVGLAKLSTFRSELKVLDFKLERKDMLVATEAITAVLSDLDPMYRNGEVDLTRGNTSLIVEAGVVIAAVINNQKIICDIRHSNWEISSYVAEVHDLYLVEPFGPAIEAITNQFIDEYPLSAMQAPELIVEISKTYAEVVESLIGRKEALARHIFGTGMSQYPGIGCQIQLLLPVGV